MQVATGLRAGQVSAAGFYNGKLKAPVVASRALTPQERATILHDATPAGLDDAVLAPWDLSRDIPSTRVGISRPVLSTAPLSISRSGPYRARLG